MAWSNRTHPFPAATSRRELDLVGSAPWTAADDRDTQRVWDRGRAKSIVWGRIGFQWCVAAYDVWPEIVLDPPTRCPDL
jgi:hypothetical protein